MGQCQGGAHDRIRRRSSQSGPYGMPRNEAYSRFVACRLEAGDTVDVFADRLERLALRVGFGPENCVFRARFYEGLPASVYEWAVSHRGLCVRGHSGAKQDGFAPGRRESASEGWALGAWQVTVAVTGAAGATW